MADGPDEQDGVEPTPDGVDPVPDEPGTEDPSAESFAEQFPALTPQVKLINDDDLSWVDKPELSEAERERRRERRDARRKKVRRKRRTRRALKIIGVLFAVFLVLGGFWFYWVFSGLERMPASAGQAGRDTPGTNFLLIGDNPVEPDAATITGHGWQHAFKASDMVMVLHLTRDGDAMFVISIPGTSLLDIPASGSTPATIGRLSDAYNQGGPKLYVKTVETYTGLAMDHVAVLNLNALREITDDLGGVTLDVPSDGTAAGSCGLSPGGHRFDGEQALAYIALFPCMPGRDVDRVQHQQALLRALMRRAVDGGEIANPFTLTSMLKTTAGHLTLEDGFGFPSILSTLFSMRGLRSSSTTFITTPIAAKPYPDGSGSLALDHGARYRDLWRAVQQDRIAEYLALNTGIVTQ